MFPSLSFKLPRLRWGPRAPSIDLPSVDIHDTENGEDKRARTLKHLLKANHANHSIIYNHDRFHNHTPHILGSAYLLGSTSEHLHEIYDAESKHLEPWRDSPGEISKEDWRDFLGRKEYQRAFIDFFEDQLILTSYNWHQLLQDYMFSGPHPLVHNLIAGLAHPLIHLGYAHELASRAVAIEALALAACFYNPWAKYLDDPGYTRPGPYTSASPLEILGNVAKDPRFDGLFDSRGPGNLERVFAEREDALLEHWNAWDVRGDPKGLFEKSQRAAAALLVAARPEGERYDFFVVHLLTSSHAIRVLLPLVPAEVHVPLVRQWWLFTVAVYVAQLRPRVDLGVIEGTDLAGRGWRFVVGEALGSRWNKDAHYVKCLRALKVSSETWGDEDQYYLKAAVKFADTFDSWGGFDAHRESPL